MKAEDPIPSLPARLPEHFQRLVVQHFLQEDQSTVDVSIHLRPTSDWQLLNIIELIHLRGYHDQCVDTDHGHHVVLHRRQPHVATNEQSQRCTESTQRCIVVKLALHVSAAIEAPFIAALAAAATAVSSC